MLHQNHHLERPRTVGYALPTCGCVKMPTSNTTRFQCQKKTALQMHTCFGRSLGWGGFNVMSKADKGSALGKAELSELKFHDVDSQLEQMV